MHAALALLLIAIAIVAHAQTALQIDGLEHVNIAVADLEAASARYRDLGFSLKPGTPHTSGIRNEHAKFPDGTELELITAPAATDALTASTGAILPRVTRLPFSHSLVPDRQRQQRD